MPPAKPPRSGAWLLARAVRHTPDRLAHGLRRRLALGRIRRMTAVRSVLVLCHGNICRSPYAERALRTRLARAGLGSVGVASAGFLDADRPSPPEAHEAARARGIELAGHRSQPVTPALLGAADLILVMNEKQARALGPLRRGPGTVLILGDLDPEPIETREISDPVDQPVDVFVTSYDRIDRCLGALVGALAESPHAAAARGAERQRTVLHVIDTPGPGGAETVLLDVAAHLDQERWHSVVAVPEPGWLDQQVRLRGLDAVRAPARHTSFDWRYLLRMIRLIRRYHADVVHAHLVTPSVYGGLAGLFCRVPVVSTFHGAVDFKDGRFNPAKFRIVNRSSAGVALVSEALQREFLANTTLDEQLTRVVHNGIDRTAFAPRRDDTLRRELGLSPGDILVGAVGNVRRAKAYDVLLRAAAELHRRNPRFRFVIAGATNGPVYPQLRSLQEELGLGEAVVFTGFRDNVARVFNNLDVYVTTSSSEGFSLTTVQALACGVPVVATRCGGPEEILTHEETGLLVGVGDHGQVAAAITRLVEDPSLAARLTKAGLALAASRFSRDGMVSSYAAMYERALGQQPVRS